MSTFQEYSNQCLTADAETLSLTTVKILPKPKQHISRHSSYDELEEVRFELLILKKLFVSEIRACH